MKTTEDEISSFVRGLAQNHPEEVDVIIREGHPLIIEIRASMDDLLDIMSKNFEIEAICISQGGLKKHQFHVMYLGVKPPEVQHAGR